MMAVDLPTLQLTVMKMTFHKKAAMFECHNRTDPVATLCHYVTVVDVTKGYYVTAAASKYHFVLLLARYCAASMIFDERCPNILSGLKCLQVKALSVSFF
jgi:hypothetical protein